MLCWTTRALAWEHVFSHATATRTSEERTRRERYLVISKMSVLENVQSAFYVYMYPFFGYVDIRNSSYDFTYHYLALVVGPE